MVLGVITLLRVGVLSTDMRARSTSTVMTCPKMLVVFISSRMGMPAVEVLLSTRDRISFAAQNVGGLTARG